MRIYFNCKEAITDIGRELKKCATTVHTQTYQNKVVEADPNFETKEIEAFSFTIINAEDRSEMPNVHVRWCIEEFKERISREPVNPGEAWKIRKELWSEFLVDGKFDYTYSERMYNQIQSTIEELSKHPETRQAIIQVHNRIVDSERMGKQRIPCSMFYQFLKRDNKLDVIYVMRSSDFITHFQNDIWQASQLRDHIAMNLGIKPGKFIMFVSSLHIYKKDWSELSNY